MKLLVTGATGFVGAVLVPQLAARYGAGTLRLMLLPAERDRARRAWPQVEAVSGDVRDRRAVERAVQGCTHVIHLAGLISYRMQDRHRLFAVNRDGTANIAQACVAHGVSRLVQVASVGSVGFRTDGGAATEATNYNWPEPFYYMSSKRAGALEVLAALRHGLEAVVLCPAAIMGPGDMSASSPHNRLYSMVRSSRVIPTFTGSLGIVDVRDVASLVIKALFVPPPSSPVLAVGASVSYALVIEAIAAAYGRHVRLVRLPASLLSVAGLFIENSGLPRLLPLPLTFAYGRMSGWHCRYDASLSRELFGHSYHRFGQTIADGCRFYAEHFATST